MSRTKVADRGVEKKSDAFRGRRIALAVCGGIASVEAVKLIRELRRFSAHVTVYATPSATAFISNLSLAWAADSEVVTEATARVDHLDPYDLVLVAPATLNTIAKSALALADNAVTLLLASQLGPRGKILFVPTMNAQLQRHPAYGEHVRRLEDWGAKFLASEIEEERLKMPPLDRVVEAVTRMLVSSKR